MSTRPLTRKAMICILSCVISVTTAIAQLDLDQPEREYGDYYFPYGVWWVEFSPDGEEILAAGPGRSDVWVGHAVIYDTTTAHEIGRIETGLRSVRGFHRSNDGTKFLTWGIHPDGGYTDLWDANTFAHLLRIDHDHTDVFSADFSPDGTKILTAGTSPVRIWDASTGQLVRQLGSEDVNNAVFSPDGTSVAGCMSWSGAQIILLDSETGLERRRLGTEWLGWPAFSPDGSMIVGATYGVNEAFLFDVSSGEVIRSFEDLGSNGHPAFSPDGDRLFLAGSPGRIFDVKTGRELVRLHVSGGGYAAVGSFAPDGQSIVTGIYGDEGYVALWTLPFIPVIEIDRQANGSARLTWENPSGSPSYILQQRSDLSVGNWEDVPVSTSGQHEITEPTGTMFFRLMEP